MQQENPIAQDSPRHTEHALENMDQTFNEAEGYQEVLDELKLYFDANENGVMDKHLLRDGKYLSWNNKIIAKILAVVVKASG